VSNTLTGSFDHIDTFGRIPRSELIRIRSVPDAQQICCTHLPNERGFRRLT
jgi:hypothetical protein